MLKFKYFILFSIVCCLSSGAYFFASFFDGRSGWMSIYARVAVREDAFNSLVSLMGERMLFLGGSNWGDRPIRDGLNWWKAHEH
jgi:hypothetical protein